MNIFYELPAMGRAQLTACLSYVAVNVSNCYSLVTKLTRKKSAML